MKFVVKLGNGEPIGSAEEEGYHAGGPAPVIDYSIPVAYLVSLIMVVVALISGCITI